MKKVLIFGCNEVTDALLSVLCSDIRYVSEICLVSEDKACCDVLKKKYSSLPVRITTARADINNETSTKMMLSIIQPELIVNLEKPELCMKLLICSTASSKHSACTRYCVVARFSLPVFSSSVMPRSAALRRSAATRA